MKFKKNWKKPLKPLTNKNKNIIIKKTFVWWQTCEPHRTYAKTFKACQLKRFFCCCVQHIARLTRTQKFVASELKKISGGVRSQDGIAAGQGANTCDTSGNLVQKQRRRSNKAYSLSKGIPYPKGGSKITKQKGGQGVCPMAGERVREVSRRGSPENERESGCGEDPQRKKKNDLLET